jgi:hypothetical protein
MYNFLSDRMQFVPTLGLSNSFNFFLNYLE